MWDTIVVTCNCEFISASGISITKMGRKRSYDNGKPLALDLKKLVVDKVEFYGCSIHTGKVPHGTFAKVSRDLSLHKTTVSKTWNKFLLNGTHEIVRSKLGK